MTDELQVVSVRLPLSVLKRIHGKRSEFVRQAIAEKLERDDKTAAWQPQTPTGSKLLRLRKRFLDKGGKRLDSTGIAAELRQRRGSVG